MDLLVKDGLIEKQPGCGSVVKFTGYSPEGADGSLNDIAFILPSDDKRKINQPFMTALFYCVERECRQHGYNLFVVGGDDYNVIPQLILKKKIRVALWVSSINEDLVQRALLYKIPSISLLNQLNDCTSILIDNYDGVEKAVEYLISIGHRNIAYINGIEFYSNSKERFGGYCAALKKNEIEVRESLIETGDWTFESGYDACKKIMSKEQPTAIFAANDSMALGAIKAIVELGLSIPNDISVMGFDNIEQSKYAVPSLSTVSVDINLLASYAIRFVEDIMTNKSVEPVKIILPASLKIRDSTKAL